MMNKVLLVGELVKNVTLQTNQNGSINTFIIATIRVPKDERKPKEVHFIYCKAFGKAIPKVLSETREGDILCVSGQVATTLHASAGGEKEYRMEIWAESVKRMPEKIAEQKDLNNPSKMINDAVRHYDHWDYVGEKSVHTLSMNDGKQKPSEERDRHLEPLDKILGKQTKILDSSKAPMQTANEDKNTQEKSETKNPEEKALA